jgi:hypothetical protein
MKLSGDFGGHDFPRRVHSSIADVGGQEVARPKDERVGAIFRAVACFA